MSKLRNMYQEVKNLNPEDYYSNKLYSNRRYRKRGDWQEGGLCPFHSDSRPGSFWINTSSGAFHCFSCGNKGGDIIAFEMQLNSCKFQQALSNIAEEWRIK